MNKILLTLVSFNLLICTPLIAKADPAYQRFKKTEIKQFNGDKAPKNCQEKSLEIIESANNKVVYELCAVKGKPIYLRSTIDGAVMGFDEFRNGKLVMSGSPDAGVFFGYRNEQPVVKWDLFNETVDWKIDADTKTMLRQNVVKTKNILKKFGIRTR